MKVFFMTISLLIVCSFGLIACNKTDSPINSANPSAPAPQSTPASLPLWTNTLDGIPFTMVGSDPTKAGAGTTLIPVVIIPVNFSFSLANTVISPQGNACGDSTNTITRVTSSPLFTSNSWTDGPITLGQTQFADAFQRANFWTIVNTVSPNYHVMLQPVSVLPAVTVEVPLTSVLRPNPNPLCIQQPVAAVPIDFMNLVVRNTIATQHITADTLPIFLTYDTAFLLPGGGFFLGYHNVQGSQTFIVASYTDPGFNGIPGYNVADIAVLSHEVGEWMNNPLGTNKVPAWGGFGIQPTCSDLLEVGDPLSTSIFAVPAGNFTYHIQELAFFSWFSRGVPSRAANGHYSSRGTFVTPAPSCF